MAEGGIVKQRTLPDQLQNLAERIGLASRYYIKNKNSSESLLPDETVTDLVSLIIKLFSSFKTILLKCYGMYKMLIVPFCWLG